MKIKLKTALTTSIDSNEQEWCCTRLKKDFDDGDMKLYFREMSSETGGEVKGYLFHLDPSFRAHIIFYCYNCGAKIE